MYNKLFTSLIKKKKVMGHSFVIKPEEEIDERNPLNPNFKSIKYYHLVGKGRIEIDEEQALRLMKKTRAKPKSKLSGHQLNLYFKELNSFSWDHTEPLNIKHCLNNRLFQHQ